MTNESFIKFLPATPTRSEIVAAATPYLGLDYSMRSVYVTRNADGTLSGKLDCLRLLLFICRDVGYLPEDFDMNMRRPRNHFGKPPSADETVWQMLRTNCTEVNKNEVLPGDVLLMQFDDIDPRLNEIHHVAMKMGQDPFPYGTMIHAINSNANGSGRVQEARIDQLCFNRIKAAYKIKGIRD